MHEIYCKDCEHFDKCVRGYMPDCPVYYPKKGIMTNEEYIRSCTFEELAGEIYEWYSAGYTTGRVGLPLNSITEIVEWLKEKHE